VPKKPVQGNTKLSIENNLRAFAEEESIFTARPGNENPLDFRKCANGTLLPLTPRGTLCKDVHFRQGKIFTTSPKKKELS
jgi:hypothetical protein